MDNKEKKLLMTKVAKGEISIKEAESLIKPKKVAQDKTEEEIEGEEVVSSINSKKDKKQRNKTRERLSKKAEEETQTRKLNHTGGK